MTSEQARAIYDELVETWWGSASREGSERLDLWRAETLIAVRQPRLSNWHTPRGLCEPMKTQPDNVQGEPDELQEHYDFDYGKAKPNRTADRLIEETTLVTSAPDKMPCPPN